MSVEQVSGSAWAECPNGVESAIHVTPVNLEALILQKLNKVLEQLACGGKWGHLFSL